MTFEEILMTRRSVRSYTNQQIDDGVLEQLLRAAMAAPSAGNQQPWQFIVVRDREKIGSIPGFHPYAKMVKKAPVAIIVCGDPDGKRWPDFWPQDCSAATQNILLAARSLGLGSVWAGIYPLEERMTGFRSLFNIPDHIHPFALIPLGWPEGEFTRIDRFNPDLVHREVWRG